MTNSPTPDDRLSQLETDTRTALAAISVMQQLTAQLVELGRVQQENLRVHQESLARHEQRMEVMQAEIVQLRQESRQIWEYLLRQSPNGN